LRRKSVIREPKDDGDKALSEDAYWQSMARLGGPLPFMPKPCHDCAVVCQFYEELSASLAKQPSDIQREVSERWFCHNNPRRACRGNLDYLEARKTNNAP
jgi:hypothetical protein